MSELVIEAASSEDNCYHSDLGHIIGHKVDEIYTCLDCLEELIRKEEQQRIIKLLEDRKALLENPNNHYITAMNIPVTKESAMAITDATIWLIKGETNE